MRAVIQRVTEASVEVDGKVCGAISHGFLILLGVEDDDAEKDADYLAEKIAHLRVFRDSEEKMNLSVLDTGGALLVISQFTLYGDCRRGRRPSFSKAAPPEKADSLYRYFIKKLNEYTPRVQEGIFQAMMKVHLVNDGPVTFLLDSRKLF
ncbi:MAG: D-aminoacyl-tRNA deacylase [Candidatus Eremiobacteraeota bacterium]|nr:D-aminoacyl-tRNA deacylase [Candidatus Eremiobacteraeota bacterium]